MIGETLSPNPKIPQFAQRLRLARHAAFLAAAMMFASVPVAAFAQLPSAQLTSVFPPGAKQGSQLEVTIAGADLDDATQLLFSHPGIVATPKMGDANEYQPAPRPVANVFTVKIAADVPPGSYETRVMSRFGISNPRAFIVSSFDELVEAAGNGQIDKAMELPLGAIVSARSDANARDFYKINLQAGQRVLVECWAERIDSRMDATLVLLNASGRELARSRDVIGRDPLIDFTAPAAGAYVIAVYDFVFAGGADYFYRLSAHTRPHVDFVFPPSGLAGSNNAYTLFGRNLPGGQPADGVAIDGKPLQKLAVNIPLPSDDAARQQTPSGYSPPVSAWIDRVPYQFPSADPVAIAIARVPVVAEQEPNNTPAQAQKLPTPFELVGQFYPKRDTDWVQFDAKKGETLTIDLVSHRLGLTSDPFMRVVRVTKNDKGEEVMTDVAAVDDPGDRNARIGSDFDTSTDDPSFRLAVPDDGIYRIMVRDQFGDSRQDPRNVYRLIVRKLEPDFGIVVVQQLPPPAPNQPQVALGVPVVRRGGSTTFQLNLDRRDDFKGDVTITVEGLPAGVTCPGAVLGGDVSAAPLVFSAAENAGPWAGPVRIVGKAVVDGKELIRVARSGAATWGTPNRQTQRPEFRLTRDVILAVVDKETAPAFVQAGEDKVWETSLGGKIEIPISLARRGEYKEAVKLTATGLPNEIKPAEINLDPNTAASKLEVVINNQQTKPGVYTFLLRSDTKMKAVRNPDAIALAEQDQAFVTQLVAQRDQKSKEAAAAKDAATKAAADATAAVKAAEQAKATTAAAAKQAADNAKAAADKAAAAKDAAGKDAGNATLAEAATAAQKAADDAAAAAKTAGEQAANADKALTDAQAKAKAADEAKVKAEQAAKEAADKLTQTNQKKQEADKRVNDTKQANQPKDVNLALVSTPIKLRVVASPLKLTLGAPNVATKQGEKAELAVKVDRLFGFADAVEITFEPPQGVAGLTAAKLAVPNGQADAKFEIMADKNATAGEHAVTVRVKAKFNNVNVESSEKVVVKIDKAS